MDWLSVLKSVAPTVASAFLGPLGGVAVAAVGNLLGVTDATQEKIAAAIQAGQLTPEQIGELKKLELEYRENERERGFKYTELEFKDRASARQANVDGGVQNKLFGLSLFLLAVCLGSEVWVLFNGVPPNADDLVVGRVLGLLDSVALMILAYWFGSSSGSAHKTSLLSQQKDA